MGLVITDDELRNAYLELAEQPDSSTLWEYLGDIFLKRLIFNKASQCYREAFERQRRQCGIEPGESEVFVKFRETQEERQADTAYNTYLEIMNAIANGEDTSELYMRAKQGLSVYPDSSALHSVHGLICQDCAIRSQNVLYVDEGIRSYNKAIVIDPSEPDYYLNLAILFTMKGDFANAHTLAEGARILLDANAPLHLSNSGVDFLEESYSLVMKDLR